MEKAGWVKLVKFHVRDPTSGTPRHGDSVTTGTVWIGCVFVHFTCTTSRQNDGVSEKSIDLARLLIKCIASKDTPVAWG